MLPMHFSWYSQMKYIMRHVLNLDNMFLNQAHAWFPKEEQGNAVFAVHYMVKAV